MAISAEPVFCASHVPAPQLVVPSVPNAHFVTKLRKLLKKKRLRRIHATGNRIRGHPPIPKRNPIRLNPQKARRPTRSAHRISSQGQGITTCDTAR